MRRLLPLALLLAGCATAPEPTPEPEKKPAVETTKPTPPPSTTTKKGNPNRAHQLDELQKIDVDIKGNKVHLWVMDDEDKQQEGMMFLKEGDVKPDEGMVFAFDSVQEAVGPNGPRGFWMHNTLIPLDIIYVSKEGKVLNIANGKVQDDTTLPASGAFYNVIELKAGTAARFGLKPGDSITLPKLGKQH